MCQYSKQIPGLGTIVLYNFLNNFKNKQIIYFKSPAVNKLAFLEYKRTLLLAK